MASHESFGHLQHKLWQKEGSGVKLAIWLLTTKSRESTRPRCANGMWDTIGKLSTRATSLIQTSSQFEVWAKSYELTKSWESKPGQFQDSSLGVPGQKAIRMWVPWSNAENTTWGKVVASPESGLWWVLWIQSCPWLVLAPRVLQNAN
jgi:hypothetical protein